MRSILDTLFPKLCVSCRTEGQHLCEDCFSLLSLANTTSPLPRSSPLAGLFSATSYQDRLVQKIIHNFKYPPFLKGLSLPLASLIIAHLALLDKPHSFNNPRVQNQPQHNQYVLIPMPLHKKRLRWRGFNQAEEIAKQLSNILMMPLCSDILVKTKHTTPQIELSEEERKINIVGVFAVQNPEFVTNKKILLVDDVYTTGSTMEEAANVLKEAGARQVFGVVVARG